MIKIILFIIFSTVFIFFGTFYKFDNLATNFLKSLPIKHILPQRHEVTKITKETENIFLTTPVE